MWAGCAERKVLAWREGRGGSKAKGRLARAPLWRWRPRRVVRSGLRSNARMWPKWPGLQRRPSSRSGFHSTRNYHFSKNNHEPTHDRHTNTPPPVPLFVPHTTCTKFAQNKHNSMSSLFSLAWRFSTYFGLDSVWAALIVEVEQRIQRAQNVV